MKTRLKLLFLLGFSAVICNSSYCQEEGTKRNINLKIYLNGFHQVDELSYYYPPAYYFPGHLNKYEISDFSFGSLSFAIERNNLKRISQEIELLPICYNQQEKTNLSFDSLNNSQISDKGRYTSLYSSFRYQVNYHFLTQKKIRPYLGLSSQIFYKLLKYDPSRSTGYPFHNQDFGWLVSLVPGIEMELNHQFALDLNIPFNFYELRLQNEVIDNPILARNLRTITKIIGNSFPKGLNFRIGLSYRI